MLAGPIAEVTDKIYLHIRHPMTSVIAIIIPGVMIAVLAVVVVMVMIVVGRWR